MTSVDPNTLGTVPISVAIARACETQRNDQNFGALAQLIKSHFTLAKERAIGSTRNGEIIAKRLSSFVNGTIRALFTEATKLYPQATDKVAICAVGGFGRDRLAPYSDIDLLILHQFKNEEEIKPFLDFVLYALFDAGFIVGQCVHTPQTAVAFAKSDMVGRTSFLDARLIEGDQATFNAFMAKFDRLRLTTKSQFVKAKLKERGERHDKSNQSRFLAEPDVKESKGGLRDLHLLSWLCSYVYDEALSDPKGKSQVLSPEDIRAFLKVERFLWSIRIRLHEIRGRANEVISFEVQQELAKQLGYADRGGRTAAERLMKHYFVNALEVGRLTRIFCARIEDDQNKLNPSKMRMFPKVLSTDEAPGKPNIRIKNGRLGFQNSARAKETPQDFLRLFRAFSKRPDFDFSPDALALITWNVAKVKSKVRRDPKNNELFIATIMHSKDPLKTMRVMSETGLLGKFLPFFGTLSGRVEYGLYRRYALDEHIFQVINTLTGIKLGREKKRHPLASEILKLTKDLTPFYLGVLLYESKNSIEDLTEENFEALLRRVCKRLCPDQKIVDDVVFSSIRVSEMIELAKRRNLSDTYVIKGFATVIGTQERLDICLVLAICHLRVVGSNTWDFWTKGQLTDIYEATSAYLKGQEEGVRCWLNDRAEKVRDEASQNMTDWSESDRAEFLSELPDEVVRSIDANQLSRFAKMVRASKTKASKTIVESFLKEGKIEAMVYTMDRAGLLANLAGAVAASRLSVRSVQVLTTANGSALDIFTLQSLDGSPLTDEILVSKLSANLQKAAESAANAKWTLSKRLGDRRSIFSVDSKVRIDQESSEECVVVEAEGRDRPGLLHKLAGALNEIGTTIKSAHIATYGERAVDTFYLQDAPGYKITNKRRLQSIERRLLNVLNADD